VKDGHRGCPAIFPVRAADKVKIGVGQNIDVLYSSDAIAVISKPVGMHSQKGHAAAGLTLDDALAGIAARLSTESLRLVHRLDKEVGGVVIVAKTRAVAAAISAVLARPGIAVTSAGLESPNNARSPAGHNGNQDGCVRKAYIGIISGAAARSLRSSLERPSKSVGSIALSHPWPKASGIITGAVTHAAELRGAKPVVAEGVTRFSVAAASHKAAVLFLEPKTGRKHQLRQHLARVLGAPLAGDARYGSTENVGGLALYSAAVTISGFGSLIPDASVRDTKLPPFIASLLRENGFNERAILDDALRFVQEP
jgi:23S rRNA pseudouridine955/2504/2580 synthase